jgi:hypothetical protein
MVWLLQQVKPVSTDKTTTSHACFHATVHTLLNIE